MSDRFTTSGILRPNRIFAKGVEESIDYPGNEHGIITNDHVRTSNGRETYTTKAWMNGAKNTNITRLVKLTHSDLEKEYGDPDDKEGKQVRDEKSSATVVGC